MYIVAVIMGVTIAAITMLGSGRRGVAHPPKIPGDSNTYIHFIHTLHQHTYNIYILYIHTYNIERRQPHVRVV